MIKICAFFAFHSFLEKSSPLGNLTSFSSLFAAFFNFSAMQMRHKTFGWGFGALGGGGGGGASSVFVDEAPIGAALDDWHCCGRQPTDSGG